MDMVIILSLWKKNKNDAKSKTITPGKQSGADSISSTLSKNIDLFRNIFRDDDTFIVRHVENQHNKSIKCCVLFMEEMIDTTIVNENILRPIMQDSTLKNNNDTLVQFQNRVITSDNIKRSSDVNLLTNSILKGDTVLLLEDCYEALIISSIGVKSRAIQEPEAEKLIRGPREGFTEPLMINLSLLRKRLETPDLKFKFLTLGTKTNTKICICYLDSLVNRKILNEVETRLRSIKIDGILASGYIGELINDEPYSPFKTVGSTERPDVVVGKLLEGRIAIVVDGTPVALTVPYVFIEYFQINEDYYINYYFSSISRILRILGFILTVSVPAIYVALMTFQQEMIPTPLLISISSSRQGVPFPTIVETMLLLIVFEILRETGTRMPTNIGQALSIVGALVLGQASVQAKIVSAPVVIVVAISGITSLMIPKIQGAAIVLRVIFLLLSAFLGFYGLIFGITGTLLHLCEMRSFGVPYLLYLTSMNPYDLKDTIIRAPLWKMKKRPKLISTDNMMRQVIGRKK
ncbi:spore germination protein [Ruminiclostridium cellulolyticum]|uniref:GerA spore germination protein n=1 Tax=Ruminiclostridium cellulolyticum (strain ATCC 35319 / DSM 5812 / JCM 6584 / H10) TaxID=394503 RepID=B8I8X6_RUMCH|nr:GerA spore germination protein [Ruminiclostridium cellulolyticum H10]